MQEADDTGLWWRRRWLLYNVIATAAAIVGFALFLAVSRLPGVAPGDDPPFGLLCPMCVLPIAWNVGYLIGYPIQTFLECRYPRRRWAPIVFNVGVAFMCVLFLTPAVSGAVAYLSRR